MTSAGHLLASDKSISRLINWFNKDIRLKTMRRINETSGTHFTVKWMRWIRL